MKLKKEIARSIFRDGAISIGIYLLPVVSMFLYFYYSGSRPWRTHSSATAGFHAPHVIEGVFKNLNTWGLPAILLLVAVFEFSFGLYENRWRKNERILDIVCFVGPKLFIRPVAAYFTLKILPWALPGLASAFSWVPFLWAFFIIAVADDLTQYWYHRLHHQVPWLWRFHRTHHSAPYMGMAMASRQNIIYTIFFSQIYLLAALTYLGLGYAALFLTGIKSLITLGAHSSIPWDKPFYKYKVLHPVAWVLERLISTPATHQAHHADTVGDGVGNYKGNFGNMFFLWDVIFGTGIITRRYPESFGIKHYKQEEWYVQFLWPFFKSRKEGSELAPRGPMVGDEPFASREAELVETKNGKRPLRRTNRVGSLGALVGLLLLSGICHAQDDHAPLVVDSFAAKIGRQTDPQIVDVRTPEEFDANHLNGAVSIDLREPAYLQGLDKFDRKKPVFIYAIQNKRSGILAQELRNNGFEEVYELRSGIASWIGAGYPYYSAVQGVVTLADYHKRISGKGPVLVSIGTRYCGLCRQVKGMVDSLQSEHDPSYQIVDIELYNNPQLVAALKEVQAVPTVLLYKDGKIVWKRTGLTFTKGDIASEIAKAEQ
jgi:sterol desaturase/sphingolipid hydroxylase (fatty acid hydroxylase superfamily)/rhodanese-related sulfurtransferase